MPKFRKRPLVIEAVQYDGDNSRECLAFIGDSYDDTLNYPNIETLEGNMRVSKGDWIIKGIKGEFYHCKPNIFEDTYEPVED